MTWYDGIESFFFPLLFRTPQLKKFFSYSHLCRYLVLHAKEGENKNRKSTERNNHLERPDDLTRLTTLNPPKVTFPASRLSRLHQKVPVFFSFSLFLKRHIFFNILIIAVRLIKPIRFIQPTLLAVLRYVAGRAKGDSLVMPGRPIHNMDYK